LSGVIRGTVHPLISRLDAHPALCAPCPSEFLCGSREGDAGEGEGVRGVHDHRHGGGGRGGGSGSAVSRVTNNTLLYGKMERGPL
jgi:hypothetical protein